MELSFYKLYPMGNSTVLVDNLEGKIVHEDYKTIANSLMSDDYLSCEQVGFICKSKNNTDYKLDMMGGELCVNALRSLGYLHFLQSGKSSFDLSSSGSDGCFSVKVDGDSEVVTLNFEMIIEHIQLSRSLSLVQLDGISHFIEELPSVTLTDDLIRARHEELYAKYSDLINDCEAVGYIPYQQDDDDNIRITPLVYVVETGTKVFESACGSGTIAVGIHEFAALNKSDDSFSAFDILQPSGAVFNLKVSQNKSDGAYVIEIASEVNLLAEGVVYLD